MATTITNLAESISSLDNDASYDMVEVDDLSELSSDDHDTVSLASTTNENEQELEEEELEDGYYQHTAVKNGIQKLELVAYPAKEDTESMDDAVTSEVADEPPQLFSKDQAFKVRMPFPDELGLSTTQDSIRSLIDGSTDDLETPKQSIITGRADSSSTKLCRRPVTTPYTSDGRILHKSSAATVIEQPTEPAKHKASSRWQTALSSRHLALLALLAMTLSIVLNSSLILTLMREQGAEQAAEQAIEHIRAREIAFHTLLEDFVGSNTHLNQLNTTHLFPQTVPLDSGSWFSKPRYGNHEIRYQALLPNHLLISLPEVKANRYPRPVSLLVQRGHEGIEANQTELIKGVFAITINEDDAHGKISYSIAFKRPVMAMTLTNDFGNRLLHRHTYQKAGSELSKVIAKDLAHDIAVARDVAKSVTNILQPDIEGRVRNVSLMLRSAATDLIVFTDRAVDTARQAEENGLKMVKRMNKDVIHVTKDLYTAFRWVAGNASELATGTIKALLPANPFNKKGILLSRERAVIISQQLFAWPRTPKVVGCTKKTKTKPTIIKKVKADVKALRKRAKKDWEEQRQQKQRVDGAK